VSGPAVQPGTQPGAARPQARPGIARLLLRRPAVVVALAVLAVIVLCAALASVISPYGPEQQDLLHALKGPSASHWLGTGELGLDVFARLVFGGRVTLTVVLIAMVVYLACGVPLGILAGYKGGVFDWLVLKSADVAFAVPSIIVTLAVLAVFSHNETAAMVAFGLLGAPGLARVVRSAAMGVRQELFVRAAITSGLKDGVIILRHVLPRVAGVILVQVSVFAATAVLMETGLGFLGVGTKESSWGSLVGEASRNIGLNPWLLVPSGGIIIVFVLALSTIGDGIRDAAEEAHAAAVVRSPGRRQAPSATQAATAAVTAGQEPTEGALLSVRGLTVTLPMAGRATVTVRDVTFDVMPGEAVGIVGESGCGKSITASALFGMLPGGGRVTAGRVFFDGQDLTKASPAALRAIRGARVGWISQDPISSLDPVYTAGAQVAQVVRLHTGCSRKEAKRRALELFALVRLPDPARVAKSYPHQLSGGMAQRVGIAAALAAKPDIIIADEPTTALDVTVQAEILDLLRDLRAGGTAILLITHNWGLLADLCSRAVVMYAGEVVEESPITPIVRDPAHPYTQALLRSDPHRGRRGQPLPSLEGTVPAPPDWPVGCHFQGRCPLAAAACRTAAVPLVAVAPGRFSRCLLAGQATTVVQAAPAGTGGQDGG
jgi:peptide/nickel transport system permease protein